MSTQTLLKIVFTAVLVLLLSACPAPQDSAGIEGENSAAQTNTENNAMDNIGPEGQLSLDEALDLARADLVERAGVAAEEIQVVEMREVVWANGAMGCPAEGMMYTQALVNGYFMLLESAGTLYPYHAGHNGHPFYCPPERSRGLKGDEGRSPSRKITS